MPPTNDLAPKIIPDRLSHLIEDAESPILPQSAASDRGSEAGFSFGLPAEMAKIRGAGRLGTTASLTNVGSGGDSVLLIDRTKKTCVLQQAAEDVGGPPRIELLGADGVAVDWGAFTAEDNDEPAQMRSTTEAPYFGDIQPIEHHPQEKRLLLERVNVYASGEGEVSLVARATVNDSPGEYARIVSVGPEVSNPRLQPGVVVHIGKFSGYALEDDECLLVQQGDINSIVTGGRVVSRREDRMRAEEAMRAAKVAGAKRYNALGVAEDATVRSGEVVEVSPPANRAHRRQTRKARGGRGGKR